MPQVIRVPESKLFVSEPSPYMFGNDENPSNWRAEGWSNGNWLKSRFHKNFAEYYDSRNPPFGCLYVCNDDLVQPHTGFGPHPHREMEIVTYIVDGELTHQDSTGNTESLGKGSVQFMSAGTGLYHSEANDGDKPCRFIQSWITPAKRGMRPKYGSYKAKGVSEGLAHLVTREGSAADAPVTLTQDVDMFAGRIVDATTIEIPAQRQGYLMCLEGSVSLTGNDGTTVRLQQYDAAELYGLAAVTATPGSQGAHLLLFKMARDGRGRTDL